MADLTAAGGLSEPPILGAILGLHSLSQEGDIYLKPDDLHSSERGIQSAVGEEGSGGVGGNTSGEAFLEGALGVHERGGDFTDEELGADPRHYFGPSASEDLQPPRKTHQAGRETWGLVVSRMRIPTPLHTCSEKTGYPRGSSKHMHYAYLACL
jgi:hypothetical protein